MKIGKEDLIRINNGFGGNIISNASIDFAIDKQKDKKIGAYKKLAYLWRTILVDHPFADGNKRTAAFLAFVFAEEHSKQVNNELLLHHAVSIAKKNITDTSKFLNFDSAQKSRVMGISDIRKIERRLKNAIR